MGLIKNRTHQSVEEKVQYILKKCKKVGMPVGIIASTPDQINKRIEEGFQFIVAGTEISFITSSSMNILSKIKYFQKTGQHK